MSVTRPGARQTAIAGFSMVELAMSICLMLILTAMAIPSLTRSLHTYQLNSAAAGVADMLKFTRFEAVRQNKKVSFLLAASGTGWIVGADSNGNGTIDPAEKQFLIAGYGSLVTSGYPGGPNIAGSGTLNVMSTNTCSPVCFSFDARGAVSPLQAYVLYVGAINNPDTSYRAIVLLPSGSTQVWSAPAGGPWHQVN